MLYQSDIGDAMTFEFVVDTREPKKIKDKAIKKYSNAKLEALRAADFAARKKTWLVGFERKTLEDFVSSVKNKRLFSQIDKLHEEYPIIVIILEGDLGSLYAKYKRLHLEFNKGNFWGTIASIVVRDNIQILWTPNWSKTIEAAYLVSQKIDEEKWRVPRRWQPKKLNTPKDLLTQIPGVTNTIAKNLLGTHDSICNVCRRQQKTLCKVKGIGPILAKRINLYLTKNW